MMVGKRILTCRVGKRQGIFATMAVNGRISIVPLPNACDGRARHSVRAAAGNVAEFAPLTANDGAHGVTRPTCPRILAMFATIFAAAGGIRKRHSTAALQNLTENGRVCTVATASWSAAVLCRSRFAEINPN